ncbi:unnamed protein product [Pleuronectes platessa]|uniref:Uncharacterized protein n=1 Tax=Pleuronectes platessa TaxID=8262 RepID=A0A9N7YA88_PLEPL|nr:unnamed protein product [Pleuronectes platessa]
MVTDSITDWLICAALAQEIDWVVHDRLEAPSPLTPGPNHLIISTNPPALQPLVARLSVTPQCISTPASTDLCLLTCCFFPDTQQPPTTLSYSTPARPTFHHCISREPLDPPLHPQRNGWASLTLFACIPPDGLFLAWSPHHHGGEGTARNLGVSVHDKLSSSADLALVGLLLSISPFKFRRRVTQVLIHTQEKSPIPGQGVESVINPAAIPECL